jgi:hypothetical protein
LKTVFVVGFYDPVKKVLEQRYSQYLETQTVIWIRQIGRHREANITELAQRLGDRLSTGTTDVLMLLAVPRGQEWVTDAVVQMMESSKARYPGVEFNFRTFENLGNAIGVQDAILNFEPLDLGEISSAIVRARIGHGCTVLCVSLDGKTAIAEALTRANFSAGCIADCFVEERITGARNSNLMEHLTSRSKQHKHLLYAWDGLRTLKPKVKAKYDLCFEAPTAAMVVDLLRRWILGASS